MSLSNYTLFKNYLKLVKSNPNLATVPSCDSAVAITLIQVSLTTLGRPACHHRLDYLMKESGYNIKEREN